MKANEEEQQARRNWI